MAASARADVGGINGGGGNAQAVLVAQEASRLIEELRRVPEGEMNGVEWILYRQAVSGTQIQMGKNLVLNGNVVDAINYPDEKRIVFSIDAVDKHYGTQHFSVLVLHEFLGIMRNDDRDYGKSVPIIKYLVDHPATMSYRGGYDSIECKAFEKGQQVSREKSSVFHGVDLDRNGFQWNAYFKSGFKNGDRRLFFRMELVNLSTGAALASMEMPAETRLEGTLVAEDGTRLYCWVHYRGE